MIPENYLLSQVLTVLQDRVTEGNTEDIESIVTAIIHAAEVRDPASIGHSQRVANYTTVLANAMGITGITEQLYHKAATMHDMGKLAVPAAILRKPGPLTLDEYAIVKIHPIVGESIYKIIDPYGECGTIIRQHHEQYNGNGYPDGLIGGGISLGARIVSIADTFDTLTTNRSFRLGMNFETALRILEQDAIMQWDPEIVPIFIETIRTQYANSSISTGDPMLLRIINDLPCALVVVNSQGSPIIQNKLATKIHKYIYLFDANTGTTIITLDNARRVPGGPHIDPTQTPVFRALRGEPTHNMLLYLDHISLSTYVAQTVSSTPIYNADGSIYGASIIFSEYDNTT